MQTCTCLFFDRFSDSSRQYCEDRDDLERFHLIIGAGSTSIDSNDDIVGPDSVRLRSRRQIVEGHPAAGRPVRGVLPERISGGGAERGPTGSSSRVVSPVQEPGTDQRSQQRSLRVSFRWEAPFQLRVKQPSPYRRKARLLVAVRPPAIAVSRVLVADLGTTPSSHGTPLSFLRRTELRR